jgi:hypothetical protein
MDIKTTLQPDGNWVAIDADNYDVDHNGSEFVSNSPAGYGATELEAIRELLAEIEERANA